jgi:hypothetical protein
LIGTPSGGQGQLGIDIEKGTDALIVLADTLKAFASDLFRGELTRIKPRTNLGSSVMEHGIRLRHRAAA